MEYYEVHMCLNDHTHTLARNRRSGLRRSVVISIVTCLDAKDNDEAIGFKTNTSVVTTFGVTKKQYNMANLW